MMPYIRTKLLLHPNLLALAWFAAIAFIVSCGVNAEPTLRPTPVLSILPTATPEIHPLVNPIWNVTPSINEQILTSDVIIRASLLSATAETETVSSGDSVASTYRPLQKLRFTAHEYLKGSGPAETVVIVRGEHTYLTETEAQEAADIALSRRNTSWDGRQGILFLRNSFPAQTSSDNTASGASGQASSQAFEFTMSNPEVQSEWDYSINTLSRAWLPAENAAGVSGQSPKPAVSSFIIDGNESPQPVISLADLRSKIAEIVALQSSGENTIAYQECIHFMITRERYYREDPYIPPEFTGNIASGSASGTIVHTYSDSNGTRQYDNFWLGGPDSHLFETHVVDGDSVPSNGYNYVITSAQPLPVGEYRISHHIQSYRYLPCDFKPDNAPDNWTITVTAPENAVHETLFSPSSGGIGEVSAAEFQAGGATTTITGLGWQDGAVTLTLSQYIPLSGYALDFIALDGSVALRLNLAADAPPSAGRGSLTWPVAERPWQDGDPLMLRIREVESAPTPTAAPDLRRRIYRRRYKRPSAALPLTRSRMREIRPSLLCFNGGRNGL